MTENINKNLIELYNMNNSLLNNNFELLNNNFELMNDILEKEKQIDIINKTNNDIKLFEIIVLKPNQELRYFNYLYKNVRFIFKNSLCKINGLNDKNNVTFHNFKFPSITLNKDNDYNTIYNNSNCSIELFFEKKIDKDFVYTIESLISDVLYFLVDLKIIRLHIGNNNFIKFSDNKVKVYNNKSKTYEINLLKKNRYTNKLETITE